jgi:hypothetical protein
VVNGSGLLHHYIYKYHMKSEECKDQSFYTLEGNWFIYIYINKFSGLLVVEIIYQTAVISNNLEGNNL